MSIQTKIRTRKSSPADRLEDLNVKTVFVLGPATQDCLKQTIVDACQLGLTVVALEDAIGRIEREGDTLREILSAGAHQATTADMEIH
ncbi:MAG: isochorismatase family protein [Nitrospirales bacterium]|nr:MAG: isochorismatase family protein [Nitrospirales bacterium]